MPKYIQELYGLYNKQTTKKNERNLILQTNHCYFYKSHFFCLFLLKQPVLQQKIIIIIVIFYICVCCSCLRIVFIFWYEIGVKKKKRWIQEKWTTKEYQKDLTAIYQSQKRVEFHQRIWYHKHYIISNYFACKRGNEETKIRKKLI